MKPLFLLYISLFIFGCSINKQCKKEYINDLRSKTTLPSRRAIFGSKEIYDFYFKPFAEWDISLDSGKTYNIAMYDYTTYNNLLKKRTYLEVIKDDSVIVTTKINDKYYTGLRFTSSSKGKYTLRLQKERKVKKLCVNVKVFVKYEN
ncbi:hypothetical protein Fleli_2231 [Bernardetia litoralis DSM 6794]|uniref:GOLD domain-containing protein n=1 Tax=Bernardetia litoralis (strain ATCC 23117 / DSM 6794 / NBRC 15988 / NCIMB 1366 / Fx l1 / Sio-4) TaxID=880071 RepID=I4AKX3_BERLS|nr:hypothetical protein [Bernardetia litoralis]AFM04608.1 hypothetical protein Fleli_2231 [Bernardetia litoralis DSM 6794]